ncbi:Mu-like prophage major head subunit gpT family protein [Rhizobium sp. YS-1r]|uniref:Mu-like prophage major head subunit gpT family protein n=1 Tax=Rhizobium sp. YS-1r TaxID=1532558 RepID=UPI00050FFDC7|nr:Mu-like prophage major head subunit gpT family protein [Rhizobium sp. YS-1r]KGD95685.1 Mu-like prophage major head subunit gpT [Rhizobium sp. YS-1r]
MGIIDRANLDRIFTGFKGAYAKGFDGAKSVYPTVAMTVPSTTSEEIYGWLGQLPRMREWIGDRVIKNLSAHGFTIKNRKFESTVSVPRERIEDDHYGIFAPAFEELGKAAAEHPDELIFDLLAKGFTSECYDGQYFFDTDHPVGSSGGDFPVTSVANTDGGAGEPWFLLDCSRAIRPLIYQERIPYKLTALDDDTDEKVFFRDEYIYGTRARSNAGFGLWQLAWGSRQTLDAAHYEVGRNAMQKFKGDEGRLLGVRPTHLVVGPDNEKKAFDLINAATLENGASNAWKGTVEVIVTPWVHAA